MSKFLFLYKGYVTPTPEIGAAWAAWFDDHGSRMLDGGNPMGHGAEVTSTSVEPIEPNPDSFTGYSILSAASLEEAIEIAKTNPMITSVVVYELARM
jgi:hypothetical protein